MKKATVNQRECVACGVCVKICPRRAISIFHGICADVDEDLCIGCSKCQKACPASVIQVVQKEVAS
ncbi:MAG TPA: 4Fe-4S binding protein [Clostridiaceae bacterium]|jgi:formate hydrogenlyase subunit 6/NADH:ubiquinone oxidoreductase subunit I|nr:4Fe-4S binding protein [Clostridiaceae bacterium]